MIFTVSFTVKAEKLTVEDVSPVIYGTHFHSISMFPDILNTMSVNQFTVFLPYTDKNKQYLDHGIITQEDFTFQGRRVNG